MGKPITARKLRVAGRIAGVAVMLALLVFLCAAAVSPTLHEAVCPDAGSPTDTCAVVSFAMGLVESCSTTVCCLAIILGVFISLPWRCEVYHAAPLFRLSPCRAPPV
jgi:hypothetical protein